MNTARVQQEASPWIRGLARAGYVAKGVQYATIGVLAALAAFGNGNGRTTDSHGALREIHQQPLGKVMLVLMAIGLAGYALWRFVEAILDPEHAAPGAKGAPKRVAKFVNGLLHSALVVYTIGLITGAAAGGSGRDGEQARGWTTRLMSWEGGAWLVGAAGIAFVLFAGNELRKAWKCKLDEHLDLHRVTGRLHTLIIQLSRFGLAARAVVFALVGVFLVTAALRNNPSRAKGLGEALGSVREWTFGGVVLGVIALGLVAYGLYELVEAKYRRIQPV